MTKTRIDVEDVFQNAEERAVFNRPEIADVEFYRDGKLVELSAEVLNYWKFFGLSNTKLILSYDWPE